MTEYPGDLAVRCERTERALTSLIGIAVMTSIVAWAVWAFTGGGTVWPLWVMVAFAGALMVGAWRAHRAHAVSRH